MLRKKMHEKELPYESSNSECREEENTQLQQQIFEADVEEISSGHIMYDPGMDLSQAMIIDDNQPLLILDSTGTQGMSNYVSDQTFIILPNEEEPEITSKTETQKLQTLSKVQKPAGSDTRPRPKYQCPYCLQSFPSSLWKKRHLLECGNVSSVCEICGEVVPHRKYLASHKKMHRTELTCSKCEYRCNSSTFLVSHMMRSHDGELSPSFYCEPCCRVYYSLAQHNSHLRIHKNGKIKQTFAYESFYEEGRTPAYICILCGAGFDSKISLIEHLNAPKTLTCPTCQDQVTNERSLAIHNERRVYCQFCGKMFCTFQLMKAHERVHTKEKPFKCPVCEAAFRTANQREVHEKIHAPPMFQCEFCGKTFRYKVGYQDHVNYHAGKLVTCTLCNRRYGGKTALLRHMRRYHKNRKRPDMSVLDDSDDK